jgi:uroporphyrinogen-III decarboxylase
MLESGAVGIEVDEFMDIDLARQKCQGRATVIRNIDPVEPLLQGTPEQRKSKCGKCLETSADSDRFILSTGCAIAAEDFTG